jgi:hypothetical protein
MRLLTAFTLVTLAFIALAPAQESRPPAPAQQPDQRPEQRSEWQSVITKQIEAFRAADGAAALSCAGEMFRKEFTKNPSDFYDFIAKSEFSPIVKSSSHSFGEFKMAEDSQTVLQIVTIATQDKGSYKAIYQMGLESEGWRVQGVTRLIPDSATKAEDVVEA